MTVQLVNGFLKEQEKKKRLDEFNELPSLTVNQDVALEMDKIAVGAFSPITGFPVKEDYLSILKEGRLSNGSPFPIPVTLDVHRDDAKNLEEKSLIGIKEASGKPLGLLSLEEKYAHDKADRSLRVFGVNELKHPGVTFVHNSNDLLLGGKVSLFKRPDFEFLDHDLTPEQTRELFKKRGWKTITGFQTRNVPHRAHEHQQKVALQLTDGLFIHPLIGWKKKGDFHPSAIIRGYEALIKHYYPSNNVVFSTLTTIMRYAGPKEAVFHALIRRNYGCTHFVVGRDHAGVHGYYDKYAAHKIFEKYPDLGIEPLLFKGAYYCKRCASTVTEQICPHTGKDIIEISGTDIRNFVTKREPVPSELMRPEVSASLSEKDII